MTKDGKFNTDSKPRPTPIALGINVEKPKFQQYAVYSKRLESYDTWQEYIPVDKIALVEAGLAYTGVGDSVRCYFCGGGLRNWERGDIPMEEHAKWYPNCPHVFLVKGKDYIEKLRRGEKSEDGQNVTTDSSFSIPTNYLDCPAAQSCLQMGYPERMVEKAITIYTETNGKCDFKGSDLCEILFHLEENVDFSVDDTCKKDNRTPADSCISDENIEPLDKLLE